MKLDRLLHQPHAILAATLVVVLMGVLGYVKMPTNLFPDVNRTGCRRCRWSSSTASPSRPRPTR